MSGTSCDGLDIAHCEFAFKDGNWNYKIINAKTYKYSESWINISSHGHTIFHQPSNGITYQIGNGANITAKTGITTISDFRTLDVALNGQGAPLVPIGDELLFPDYDYCLNLGGFANISFKQDNKRIAFDICPVNIAINYFTSKYFNLLYDKNGNFAKKGKVNINLLEKLNSLSYYKLEYPKSLGREWFEKNFINVISNYKIDAYDLLRTLYEHIAIQLSLVIENTKDKTILVTGGGAFNSFLIEILKNKTKANIIIPEENLINFKEALIFAFLGLLRFNKNINCLSSVTGAKKDNCGGIIYLSN